MSQILEKKKRKLNDEEVSEESSSEEESSDEDEDEDSNPAEAGIIERLELRNFMCHDYFELSLGPQLNFIIGRNGSGKSAILTGISVGLGAKAADTSRGSSLKKLIKDGKNTARITIVLKNEGKEAYNPEVFGPKIVIERKLQRQGTNSYSIKTSSLKTVSSKKSLIDKILYNFNITVDNPLALLSQDKAREFLTLTTDHSKYEYFMAGSLINDILENYHLTSRNIVEVQKKMEIARSHLEVATSKYEETAKVYNRFRKSDALRRLLELIHAKIYWFNVLVIEKKIQKYQTQLTQAKEEIEVIDQKLREFESKSEKRKENLEKIKEKKYIIDEEINESSTNYEEAKVSYQNMKMGISEIRNEIEKTNNEIKGLKNDVKKFTDMIDLEKEKIETVNGSSRDKMLKTIEQTKANIAKLESENEKLKSQLINSENNPEEEVISLEREIKDSEQLIRDLKEKQRQMLSFQGDKYSAWGVNVSKAIKHIKSYNNWHRQPIGPLGSYIEVKEEFSDWKDLINTALGKTLDSFLVCDEHDRRVLSDILKRYRLNKNIITRNFERFSYEGGIPEGLTTFLDVLKFSDENVFFTLIDANSIEKNVITDNRSETRKLINQRNVLNVFSLLNNRSGQRSSGDNNSFRVDPIYYRINEPLKLSTASLMDKKDIQRTEEQIDNEIMKLNKLKSRHGTCVEKRKKQQEQVKLEISQTQLNIRQANDEVYRLENAFHDDGDLAKIEGLKVQIQESQDQISHKESVLRSLKEDLASEHSNFVLEKSKLSEAKSNLQNLIKSQEQLSKMISDSEVEGTVILSEIRHYEMRKDKRLEIVKMCEEKIMKGNEKLASLIQEAETKCPRGQVVISESDTSESITTEYENAQLAVKEAEKSIGLSYEEIQTKLLEDKEKKEACEVKLTNLESIYASLARDLNSRFNYLHTTILKSTNEASASFERSLALRGFKGDLKFDFKEKTLKMLVQTKGDLKKRSVESLSGGEKSFSQIALLLAIWKVMDSKIRGLDEFDVFMDAVNRTISIKLLLSELRQYSKSQAIFITPQDIMMVGNLDGKDIKIHRMNDPRSS